MSSNSTVLRALAGLALLLSACSSASTSGSPVSGTVTDTLGKKFKVDCGGNLCRLTPLDPNTTVKSCVQSLGTDTFVLVLSNILTIMALPITTTGEYQLSSGNPAHPVACTADADCLAPGLALNVNNAPLSYACANGICRLPGQPLLTNDVIALCQADIPWPKTCPYLTEPKFAARMLEVAAVCGPNFECANIPASCAQLTPPPDAGVPSATPDAGSTPIDAAAVPSTDANAADALTADGL